jgi:hypothetical protein
MGHRLPSEVRFKDGSRLFFIEADRIQRRENLVDQGLNAGFSGHEAKQVHNLIYPGYDETPKVANQRKPLGEGDLAPSQKRFTGFSKGVFNVIAGGFRVGFNQFSRQRRTVFNRRTHGNQPPANNFSTAQSQWVFWP